MLYIHQSTCISHLPTFDQVDLSTLLPSTDNRIYAIEPAYKGIAPGHLRRMGRAVRMGVGAGLPLLMEHNPDGILIGTANGGIEDSIKFLNQIIEYDEGTLTPTNFVQSTLNAIAGQLGMITKNTGYNITHVHRGLAFENALLDAVMLLREHPQKQFMVGGVDEISPRNDQMEYLDGWYKKESVSNLELLDTKTTGSLPGEGSAMFIVNNKKENADAQLSGLKLISSNNSEVVRSQLKLFIEKNLGSSEEIDLFIQGENGDSRMKHYYTDAEQLISPNTTIACYKHVIGEFQTSSAIAMWLSCRFLNETAIPEYMIKRKGLTDKAPKTILIYNNYKGLQHSFILLKQA